MFLKKHSIIKIIRMNNRKNKVAVIILNYNALNNTIECLESLKKVPDSDYRVIVVDNGSDKNDAAVLEDKYKNFITLIKCEENLGFAEGNNKGIQAALADKDCQYIFCLNNDAIVKADALRELVQCADKEDFKEFGSFQPRMLWYYHWNLIDAAGLWYSKNGFGFSRGGFEVAEKYDKAVEIFGCCGGACLYRADAVRDVMINGDFFDRDFFAYYEDFDVAFRLQWAGWKSRYCPSSIIYHKRGETAGVRSKFTAYYGTRNQIWNLVKNVPLQSVLKNVFFILVAQLAQVAINILKGRFDILGEIFKGKRDGWLKLGKILEKREAIKKKVAPKAIEKWFIWKWRVKSPKF